MMLNTSLHIHAIVSELFFRFYRRGIHSGTHSLVGLSHFEYVITNPDSTILFLPGFPAMHLAQLTPVKLVLRVHSKCTTGCC